MKVTLKELAELLGAENTAGVWFRRFLYTQSDAHTKTYFFSLKSMSY